MTLPCASETSLQHPLQALLELAPVLGARDQRAHVEGDHAPLAQRLGHVAGDDPLGEALDDRRLADAGLADQDRVVLGAAREHLDHAADLLVAADHGVELALLGDLGQVGPKRSSASCSSSGLVGDTVRAAHLGQRAERSGVTPTRQLVGGASCPRHSCRFRSASAPQPTIESANGRRRRARARPPR